jgi:multiple sugar transport system ATP-binding protein
MGRAIVRDPQVFLMDEPLSNLDAKLRVQMRAEISAVVRSLKTTTLYVTHDQTEAMTMGDRMAVMKAGVLNQLGTPSECYDSPNNIFVAQFVGSPPMNLVVASVEDVDGALGLVIGADNRVRIPDSTFQDRPALKSYVGKKVVVGMRSEDMEDASLPTASHIPSRLQASVTLTEALGSEIIVHFTFDGETYVSEDTKLLQKESGEEELHTIGGEGVKWVASFGPRSQVRMGDTVEIAIDLERAHYFDPETSEAIRT